MIHRVLTSSLALLAFHSTQVFAQDQINETSDDVVEEIIVSSRPIGDKSSDITHAISILKGEELDRMVSSTLGATLDSLPGMSQTSFGPAVSRPIIRGLGGDRIRILMAGIGSIDAASSSPDHATAADPETAEKIEILRGPATLLFGNNAVGGVVNIFDGRIPTSVPSQKTKGILKSQYGLNGEEKNMTGWLTQAISENLVLHVDGNHIKRGDMTIPGLAESKILREHEEEEGEDHGHEGEETGSNSVHNSSLSRTSGAFGLSWFHDNGFIGASVSTHSSNYGLPVHAHGAEEHEEDHDDHDDHDEDEMEHGEEDVRIALKQNRFDLHSEQNFDGSFIAKAKFRFGYADYEHKELEGHDVGTVFTNKGYEGRLELVQKAQDGLTGAFGFQHRSRDFAAIGEESFVPQTITKQTGIFILESFSSDNWIIEAGARMERQSIVANDLGFEHTSNTTSLSASLSYSLSPSIKLALNSFRTERAPNADELLSNGPHLATGSYEMGNLDLTKETALGLDVGFAYELDDTDLHFGVFYNKYNDFIYKENNGDMLDDLPVFSYTAADTRFWGIEADFHTVFIDEADRRLTFSIGADMVRAVLLDTKEALPRIPPISLHSGLSYTHHKVDVSVDLTWTAAQNRVAEEELPTDSYTQVNSRITYHPDGHDSPWSIYIAANNMFNAEIRHHASFLKDLLPEAGREVRFGIKANF